MLRTEMDVHVHYLHSPDEVSRLNKAIVPLHDNIVAVSSGFERGSMKRILGCNYFRRKEAANMRVMLLRAAKHTKANLQDYFPMMRGMILEQALELEDAVTAYWTQFCSDATETQPSH